MTPPPSCPKCGADIRVGAQFCTSCGTAVVAQRSAPGDDVSVSGIQCTMCGNRIVNEALSCPDCGAATGVSGAAGKAKSRVVPGPINTREKLPPLRLLQSWKLTAAMAFILVVTVIGLKMYRTTTPPSTLSPKAMETVKEVESLQAIVEREPKNLDALLRLANLYYDIKIFPRAVMIYDRYLALQPDNSDARVDMGISYFQMAIEDSTNRDHYYDVAIDELNKALVHAPQHQLAYYNLGMIYLHRGDMMSSSEAFKKCITIDAASSIGKRAQQLIHEHSTSNPS